MLFVALAIVAATDGGSSITCPSGTTAVEHAGIWEGERERACAGKDGGLSGPVVITHPNDAVAARGQLADGMRTGHWESFDERGTRYLEATYERGETLGGGWLWKGKGETCPTGTHPHFDIPVNNSPGTTVSCRTLARNDFEGTHREWHPTGQAKCQGQWRDGLPHAEWQWWWPNGLLALTGAWDRGVRVGRWKHYSREGKLIRTETYGDEGHLSRVEGLSTGWREPNY